MTEKRFVDYFDKDHNYIIQDLRNEDEYQVGFVNCDEDVFLELINQLNDENEQLKQQVQKIHKLIDENIRIYEDTTTNDDFLQIQLDTKLQTLYNLRRELNIYDYKTI